MEQNRPIVIAICGGSGSGKTTLTKELMRQFGERNCCLLAQDNYYKDQRHCFDEDGGRVNFDHPSSLDFALFEEHLKMLMRGESVPVPIYHFHDHSRAEEVIWQKSCPIVFIEGTLILTQSALRILTDTSIFLDIEETVRFERRLLRDVRERGRKAEGVYKQFFAQVKPMHDLFVSPSKVYAQWLIHDNKEAATIVSQIVSYVQKQKKGMPSLLTQEQWESLSQYRETTT